LALTVQSGSLGPTVHSNHVNYLGIDATVISSFTLPRKRK